MYCPICRTEYIRTATTCSDCQVALVPELPATSPENAPSADESFVLVWAGMIPQRHEEVREVLERESIPARTIHRDDHVFGTSLQSTFSVYVPASMAVRAKALLMAPGAPGLEEGGSLDATDADEPEINELPEEEYDPAESDLLQKRADWHADDATAEIWSGEAAEVADMIAACLRENQIECRRNDEQEDDTSPAPEIQEYKLFVLPEDEQRAREIVHEIIDAAPPD